MLARFFRLPLLVEEVELEVLERPTWSSGRRQTALLRLCGGGLEGRGEDVTFQERDLLERPPAFDLFRGVEMLGELWDRLESSALFEREPRYAVVRNYRRWAIEAAALDLALLQANLSLGEALGRAPKPVRFVLSPVAGALRRFPGLRLKVDASDLEPDLPVDVVDFKGSGDDASVERASTLYPHALLEDPPVVSAGARISWDIDIHSAANVARLPAPPAAINVKPARLGSLRNLFGLYEYCDAKEIALYGGGQHELGPGRAQIQLLAALFHPDAPNDVAPSGYNEPAPPDDLPRSPLNVSERPGFR